jgi:purine-binding chemotaxis protein CheW
LPDQTKTVMGLIVDAVEEVVNLTAAEIEPTPDFGGALVADYILGMAKVKGQVKALLDIDRVVSAVDPAELQLIDAGK